MAATNRLALLVGCNYPNLPQENQLHGCINDVNAMHDLIRQRFGFQENNITILINETATFSNIIAGLNQMIKAAKPGDTLLFYFSGGGALAKGIPVIVPCEDKPISPITGKQILDIIKPLPATAIFTFICDSSYSGGLFDENNVQIQSNVPDSVPNFGCKTIPSNIVQPIHVSAKLPAGKPLDNDILFSSSQANEESVEVRLNGNQSKAFSVYSSAIQELFNSPLAAIPPVGKTNGNLQDFTTTSLGNLKFSQHPGLIPSNGINSDALFLGGYVP